MTEVSSNISWDMLDMKEKVSSLQKLNSSMPIQLIEDLVKMYDELNEEQKKEMDNNLNDTEVHIKTERVPDDVPDAVSIMSFNSVEESDAFLVKEGKLTQEELDAEKHEIKLYEKPEIDDDDSKKPTLEPFEYDSKNFEDFLENNK